MPKLWEITVPTVIDRKYRVTAESEEQALNHYRELMLKGGYAPLKSNIEHYEDDSQNAQELNEYITPEVGFSSYESEVQVEVVE